MSPHVHDTKCGSKIIFLVRPSTFKCELHADLRYFYGKLVNHYFFSSLVPQTDFFFLDFFFLF